MTQGNLAMTTDSPPAEQSGDSTRWGFLMRKRAAAAQPEAEAADLGATEGFSEDLDADCVDALELAVEMAEAIRLAEARITALEAQNVEMRAQNAELRTYVTNEIPALRLRAEAAAERAERAETAMLAFEERERETMHRAQKAEQCLGRVREQLQTVRQTRFAAAQRRPAAA
jgi:chromosome segregation ATPase